MPKKKKTSVLFAAFEAVPFIKTGGLGDVAGALPGMLNSKDMDVRVILPKLSSIPRQYTDKMEYVASLTVPLGWRRQYCGIETLKHDGVTYYFLDNEYYFKRDGAYGFGDDSERIAFFSKAILECLQYLPDFFPELIHCNDWHTALVPVFLHEHYGHLAHYRDIKVLYTIHNLKFQGIFPRWDCGDVLGLTNTPAETQLLWGDAINFMKGAVCYSDWLSTVSPTYADEICTSYYGEGLDSIFRSRRSRLSGILNGIDIKEYDPEHDKLLKTPFNVDDLTGKAEEKARIQKELGLPVREDVPMITMISRLTEQKGMDLLVFILDELLQEDVQVVVLGIGDAKYEHDMRHFGSQYPEKCAPVLKFDTDLSHRLYAAADLLLMPSLFEPCGLSQMIAMRYGTLPVVRETGGLKDSVTPYNQYTGEGTGFSFSNYNAHELLFTLQSAVKLYAENPEAFHQLRRNAMTADFSWVASAKQYRELYLNLLGKG
ncbi:MAG: glycogen synthase GlgA [Ruminococcaceae bacterium]|nr:glycogen synthase GlgA [Oscillospiraceae bacterium]